MKRWSWLPGLILLMGLVFFVLSKKDEGEQFFKIIIHLSPIWLFYAVAFQAGTYLSAAGIWQVVLKRQRIEVSSHILVRLAFQKIFVDQLLPSGGLSGTFVFVNALKRQGVPAATGVLAVFINLLSFYIAYSFTVIVSIFILIKHNHLTPAFLTLSLIFAAVALAIPSLILWLTRHREWSPPSVLRRLDFIRKFLTIISEVPAHLVRSPSLLISASIFQLFIFIFDAGTLYIMLKAIHCPVDVHIVFVSFIFASMAQTLSLIPGGVGTFEAGALGMLAIFGVPIHSAFAATLLLRGFTLWIPLIPGVLLIRHQIKK